MGLVSSDDGWRMPDWLWERVDPLLPARPTHPLGCHRPRVSDRAAMDAILLVLRTGMQWNALNATEICSSSSAHRRFQEWERSGVFHEIWRQGLLDYDETIGIDWVWLSCDGATGKAPLGGEATGPNPTDRAKKGRRRSLLCEAAGIPIGVAHDSANRHDSKLLAPTLDSVPNQRPEPSAEHPQGLCLDGGYAYPWVNDLAAGRGYPAHIRRRSDEIQPLALEQVADDLLARHPLPLGHRGDSPLVSPWQEPTSLSAAVAGPSTRLRPTRSYTTL